jgi:hypothetical protein
MTTFKLARGATKQWLIQVTVDGAVVDLTGAKCYFTAKLGATTISKRSTAAGGGDAQIQITDAALGKYLIKVDHADVEALNGRGVCDSWVIPATGPYSGMYIQTVAESVFVVENAVTTSFPP